MEELAGMIKNIWSKHLVLQTWKGQWLVPGQAGIGASFAHHWSKAVLPATGHVHLPLMFSEAIWGKQALGEHHLSETDIINSRRCSLRRRRPWQDRLVGPRVMSVREPSFPPFVLRGAPPHPTAEAEMESKSMASLRHHGDTFTHLLDSWDCFSVAKATYTCVCVCVCVRVCVYSVALSRVRLLVTPRTVAHSSSVHQNFP